MTNNNQWIHRYRQSLRFAAFFNSEFRFDIVHSAWLYFLEKTGKDLFEMELTNENSYLYTVVKKAFYRWNHKERKGERYIYTTTDVLTGNFDDPLEYTIANETLRTFKEKILQVVQKTSTIAAPNNKKGLLIKVFDYKLDGFSPTEIAEYLGISRQSVHNYINKIQEMSFSNPFNGSRLPITKTITESQWNKRNDHEEFETIDYNEYYRLLQHTESKEGWLVKLPVAKTNPYIY